MICGFWVSLHFLSGVHVVSWMNVAFSPTMTLITVLQLTGFKLFFLVDKFGTDVVITYNTLQLSVPEKFFLRNSLEFLNINPYMLFTYCFSILWNHFQKIYYQLSNKLSCWHSTYTSYLLLWIRMKYYEVCYHYFYSLYFVYFIIISCIRKY